MARFLRFTVAAIAALSFPTAAFGGTLTLHPSGFGEHSYSSWKGQEGEADSNGSKNEALYFQKMTSTATNAAGVAVIKGFEGLPLASLSTLAFDWRLDGHCGAGAPRFNIRVDVMGVRQTIFVGCQEMVPSNGAEIGWQRRTFAGPGPFAPGTIVSLAIVYDEGIEFPPGYIFLDNIQVNDHVWTSASDNGNGATITQSSDPLDQLLGETPLDALAQ